MSQELRTDSEQRLREAQVIGRMGDWQFDVEKRRVFWSDTLFELCARDVRQGPPSLEEGFDYLFPEDRRRLEHCFRRALETGESYALDLHVRLPGGHDAYHHAIGHARRDRDGKVVGLYGIAQDITGRKQIEARLAEQAALLDHARDAIIVRDISHRITYWNKGAERLHGWTAEDAVGQSALGLLYRDVASFEAAMGQLLQRGDWADEFDQHDKAGNPLVVESRWTLVRDEQGRPRSVLVIDSDITDRKLAEAARVRIESIMVLEKEKSRMARELHDQLGQRLTALRMVLSFLRGPALCDPNLRASIASIDNIVGGIDADVHFLVSELRPYTLATTGIATAIERYVRTWSRHCNLPAEFQANGLVRDRLPPDVELTLYRIAQEALGNVARHAAASRVSVYLEQRDDTVVLTVRDDGRGFETNRPLDNSTEPRYGLAGMRERANLVGGTVEIDSAPGHGTSVVARLPLNG